MAAFRGAKMQVAKLKMQAAFLRDKLTHLLWMAVLCIMCAVPFLCSRGVFFDYAHIFFPLPEKKNFQVGKNVGLLSFFMRL